LRDLFFLRIHPFLPKIRYVLFYFYYALILFCRSRRTRSQTHSKFRHSEFSDLSFTVLMHATRQHGTRIVHRGIVSRRRVNPIFPVPSTCVPPLSWAFPSSIFSLPPHASVPGPPFLRTSTKEGSRYIRTGFYILKVLDF